MGGRGFGGRGSSDGGRVTMKARWGGVEIDRWVRADSGSVEGNGG